jgi:Flp pilus assembly protein TadD
VPRIARGVAAAALLVALALATRAQLATWRDSVSLAERALAVSGDDFLMHFNLALALDERGDLPGAVRHYEDAVRLRPDLALLRVNLAAALARAGRVDQAIAQDRAAAALDPGSVAARNNLAWLRATHPVAAYRDGAEALALAREVVRRDPQSPDALDLLAAALAENGRFGDAERTAGAALAAARAAGRTDLAAALEARRALYAAGRPYRETPGASPPAAAITPRSPAPRDASPRPPAPSPATAR